MLSNVSIILSLCATTIAAFSQVLLKKSANNEYETFLKQYLNRYVIIGYCMLLCSMLLTVAAFSGMDFKYGPALESIGFVLVAIFSVLFFKEKFTKKIIIGNILIVTGLIIFCI